MGMRDHIQKVNRRLWTKGTLLMLLCYFVTLLPCHAQRITARKQTINVGQVMYRQPVIVDFELHNNSNHSTIIDKVRTSCGCTTAEYPQGTIQGDANFTLRAIYDANQMGHFEKQIGVYTDGNNHPFILTLKGVVVEEVVDFVGDFPYRLGNLQVDQNSIAFEDVNRGDRPMAKIHILNTTDDVIEPVIMHLPDYMAAEVSPSKIRPGRSGVALLTLDTRKIHDYGLTQTTVYLGSKAGEKVSTDKAINISAVLLPGFSDLTEEQLAQAPHILMSTTTLNLGQFDAKKKKLKGEIDIQNIGHSILDLSHIQVYTVGLQVSLGKTKLAPGEYTKLKITAVVRDLRLVRNPRVLIITNDPTNPKVVVNVEAQFSK